MSGFFASQWINQVTNRTTSYVGDLNTLIAVDEYSNNSLDATFTTGGGSINYQNGISGGVARLRSGATALLSGNAVTFNEGGAHLIGSPLNESWMAHARCKFSGTITNVDTIHTIGVQDGAIGAVTADFVGFGIEGTQDTQMLCLTVALSGGTPAYHMSIVAADFDNWHDYAILRKLDTALGIDKLICLVDDTEVLNLDGPFAELTPNPVYRYTWVSNGPAALGPNNTDLYTDNTCVIVKGT